MGYKSPYNKVGQLKPEMKNQSKSSIAMKESGIYMKDQSPLSMSPLNKPDLTKDQRLRLEETAARASSKLENAVDIKSGYGQTQEKKVITGPKQRKLDVGAYEQTYREAAESATGKQFGYSQSLPGDVTPTSSEQMQAGFGEAARSNVTSQREQFQKQFGKGVQPNKPFMNETDLSGYNTSTGKKFLAAKDKQKNLAAKRFESNVLAETTRQKLEEKPVTITTRGVMDASTYGSSSTPAPVPTSTSTKSRSRGPILGPKSFKSKSAYKAYKKSFK